MLREPPDPESAASAVEAARANGCVDEATLALLARVASVSRVLGRFLGARPAVLADLVRFAALPAPDPAGHVERARADRAAQLEGPDGLARAIRIYRHRETARVLLRDLDDTDLASVAAEISDIAAACFEVALADAIAATGPVPRDPDGAPIPFTVLGMGKLGGRELNYSSDVDVVYVYGTDRGDPSSTVPHEYWNRVASRVSRALADVTEDGVAFRVDLDLRPEGTRGPMVNSLRSMEVYYESYGATWERAAWLKARPIAGDHALGEALLASLEPFVYRRWLDYATIEAIREMKAKIDRSRHEKSSRLAGYGRPEPGFHVKLGAGGIRELEFFVQTLQLVNAGKRPDLRARGTLEALRRLAEGGLVDSREAASHAEAYVFLRRLEHRLQARELAQTHVLPDDPAELAVIARSMGFEDSYSLLSALEHHRKIVAEAFDGLFAEKTRQAAESAGPEVALLADPELDEARARSLAAAVDLFTDPASAADAFARIRRGPLRSRQRERAFGYLARIAPPLFDELRSSPDADAAVGNLERFLSKIGGRTTLLALLAENPPTVKLLVRLFGSSEHLARGFIGRPELIDLLLGSGWSRPVRHRAELRAEIGAMVEAASGGFEERLEAIRRFRIGEMLRIAMIDLWGDDPARRDAAGESDAGGLDVLTVLRQLSDVADAVLDACLRAAANDLGIVPEERTATPGFVVLGLGRLGGREMTYGSDVDLVFLYAPPPGPASEAGTEEAHAVHDRFVKLAQKFVAAVSAPTREGIAYRVDTRLRPSGSSGPLVVSLAAFDRYQREQARTWERQALLRARPVAGDLRVWSSARTGTLEPALRRPVDRTVLAQEVAGMRERMERELAGPAGRVNLKTGRGGLVDIEFAAQYLQLAWLPTHPGIRAANTLRALSRAAAAGVLAAADHAVLREGYRFLTHLENRMRIVADRPVDAFASADSAAWNDLARRARLAGGDGARLARQFEEITAAVRGAYARVVGSA